MQFPHQQILSHQQQQRPIPTPISCFGVSSSVAVSSMEADHSSVVPVSQVSRVVSSLAVSEPPTVAVTNAHTISSFRAGSSPVDSSRVLQLVVQRLTIPQQFQLVRSVGQFPHWQIPSHDMFLWCWSPFSRHQGVLLNHVPSSVLQGGMLSSSSFSFQLRSIYFIHLSVPLGSIPSSVHSLQGYLSIPTIQFLQETSTVSGIAGVLPSAVVSDLTRHHGLKMSFSQIIHTSFQHKGGFSSPLV